MKLLYRLFMLFMALLLAAGLYLTVAGAREHQNRPLIPRGGGVTACAGSIEPFNWTAWGGAHDAPLV